MDLNTQDFSFKNKPGDDPNKDIIRYFNIFINYWPLFIICLLIGIGGSYLFYRMQEPEFTLKASVLINKGNSEQYSVPIDALSMVKGVSNVAETNIENQIILLQTPSLIRRTLRKLNFNISYFDHGLFNRNEIYPDAPFIVKIDSSHVQAIGLDYYVEPGENNQLLIKVSGENVVLYDFLKGKNVGFVGKINLIQPFKIGQKIITEFFSFSIFDKKIALSELIKKKEYSFEINNVDKMVGIYSDYKISLAKEGTSILNISMKCANTDKSILFLDKLMEVWIADGLGRKNKIANNTINFIDQQLLELSDSLTFSGHLLERFQSANKVVAPEVQMSTFYQKLQQLDEKIIEQQYQLAYLLKLETYLKNRADYDKLIAPAAVGVDSPVLVSSINQIVQIRQELITLEGNEKISNPYLDQLHIQETVVLKVITENILTLKESIQYKLGKLTQQKDTVEREQTSMPSKDLELLLIQRKFNLTNEVYTQMMARRVEAQIQQVSNLADSEVIEYASFVGKLSPIPQKIFSLGVSLSLILPGLFLFLWKLTNNKISSKDEILDITSISILGYIAQSHHSDVMITTKYLMSPITEAFRAIRFHLEYLVKNEKQNIILITSAMMGEGKTFCAVNLAGILSQVGKRTIVLGFDLRKPKMENYFKVNSGKGISTYLMGKDRIDDIIHHHGPNLDYMLSGPIPPNPSELIESELTKNLFDELKKRYDNIIIDTSPVGLVTDALLLSAYSNVNILLVRDQVTLKSALKTTIVNLEKIKLKNLCIVINGLDLRKHGKLYGYGYGYGYANNYSNNGSNDEEI